MAGYLGIVPLKNRIFTESSVILLFTVHFVFNEHLGVFCRIMTFFILTFLQWSVYAPFMFISVFLRWPHRLTYFTFKTFPRVFLHVADKVSFMFKLPRLLFSDNLDPYTHISFRQYGLIHVVASSI